MLGKEQIDLLFRLVEMARNTPREKRSPFVVMRFAGQNYARVYHPGISDKMHAYLGDIDLLADEGFVRLSPSRETDKRIFDITPEGFEYYRQTVEQDPEPVNRVEFSIGSYLDADDFKLKYPKTYNKWAEAESIVWGDNYEQQLTVIGHLCREALLEFANRLVEIYEPQGIDGNRDHTANRIEAVLAQQHNQLGSTETPFLEALIRYWRTVSDIVQRQEHGAQREGALLTGEDGRRAVFQAAVVMFEIDRALSRTKAKGQSGR